MEVGKAVLSVAGSSWPWSCSSRGRMPAASPARHW